MSWRGTATSSREFWSEQNWIPETQLLAGGVGSSSTQGTKLAASLLLYQHVFRVLKDYWSRDRGYRNVKVHPTARGGRRGAADWVHPDAVLEADPARRSSKDASPFLHSFEIERAGGFRIESIFQAFVQGRGADYSWVVFSESEIKTQERRDRVLWAAGTVDVGLISYVKPGSWTTWLTLRNPKRRSATESERQLFKLYALGAPLEEPPLGSP